MVVAVAFLAGMMQLPAVQQLDSAITAEVSTGFSGVVLVARGDTMLLERAYGRAAATGVAPQDLAFWLASNSKQFTAVAILRLREMGRLQLADSLGRFFPHVPPDKRGITIHQLLTHTSGLPHAYRADGITDSGEAISRILALKLESQPGEKFSYSNDGYTLLALIIHSVSGSTFDAFLQDSLFARAGLAHTGLWGGERMNVRIAPVADPGRAHASASVYASGHSVGNWGYRGPTGVYAPAHDVYQWIRALQKGLIISPAALGLLVGHHVLVRSDSTGTSYAAYGWGTRVENGRDVSYGHVGDEDWLGHNGVIRWSPGGDVVVVLANSGDINNEGWASRVNRIVRRIMPASR